MDFLRKIQNQLEEVYGAKTGLDVVDFVRPYQSRTRRGELLVEQIPGQEDINLALLLDRDILEAWESHAENLGPQDFSVPFEEVSHFVYLSFNHNRGRSVTQLEMEIQSEVDRVWLAFHGNLKNSDPIKEKIWEDLFSKSYHDSAYEEARVASANFLKNFSDAHPAAWTAQEFQKLCNFFHSDLQGKLRLSQKKPLGR